MENTTHLKWLRYPAYGLYHLESLEQSAAGNYCYDIVPTFGTAFNASGQYSIIAALNWALECDTLDWKDILPELPHSDGFMRSALAS